MHFYLFDAFLANPAYKKDLEEIENRILDLGIGGRSTYLSVLKSFEDSLIRAAGFQNAVDFAGFQTLSMEQIIKNPPDFLLYTTPFETPSFATNILHNCSLLLTTNFLHHIFEI